MADLKTTYMGLELDNPLIAASSGITGGIDGVKKCADAGVGAIVLKSLLEELIIANAEHLEHDMIESEHPEATEYIRAQLGMQLGPKPYLRFIEDARKAASCPVIASVNCVSAKWWAPYAKNIEEAGARGIELNISHFPGETPESSEEIEKRYCDITAAVADRVSIPVAVKVGTYFTSIANTLECIAGAGAGALVMFNRYYSVDIDIEKKTVVPSMTLSSGQEMTVPLRWIGLLSQRVSCDIAASTGIHNRDGIIKMLMAGATAVQLCSILYRHGPGCIAEMRTLLNHWLDDEGYASVEDIRGAAVSGEENAGMLLKRLQYVKALNDAGSYEY